MKNKMFYLFVSLLVLIVLFVFTGELQIGDDIIVGKHFDTPLRAYEYSEDVNIDDIYDIKTINITDDDAIWITNVDDYLTIVQMYREKDKFVVAGNDYSYTSKKALYDITYDTYTLKNGEKLHFVLTTKDIFLSEKLNKKKCEYVEFTCDAYGEKDNFIFIYK